MDDVPALFLADNKNPGPAKAVTGVCWDVPTEAYAEPSAMVGGVWEMKSRGFRRRNAAFRRHVFEMREGGGPAEGEERG